MAGCDFLPSLPNIGMKKAHRQIKKLRSFVKVGAKMLGMFYVYIRNGHLQSTRRFLLPLCFDGRFASGSIRTALQPYF